MLWQDAWHFLFEKIFSMVAMLIAGVFAAFVYAESANVVSSFHASFTEYVLKKKDVKKWM